MITFEYQGRTYKPSNLEKKLKNLGITINDVKIIDDTPSKNEQLKEKVLLERNTDNSIYYCFWDKKGKGWLDSKTEDISDFYRKDDFILMGSTLNKETNELEPLEEVHKRLFQEAIVLKTDKECK